VIQGAVFLLNLSCGLYLELFLSLAYTCTKEQYIITVISFTYQKMDKGTSQQESAFVNVRNVSRLAAVHDSLQGHILNLTGHDQLDLHDSHTRLRSA